MDGAFDMASVQKFTVVVAAGGMDILISSPEIYDIYKDQGFFMNMSEIFTPEELSQSHLIDNNALKISHYQIVAEEFNLFYETVYFMVISNVDLDEVNHDGMTKRELVRGFYQYVIAGMH
jgi:hypothetical protein